MSVPPATSHQLPATSRFGLWARQFLYTGLVVAAAIAALALIVAGFARQFALRRLQDELHQEAQLVGEYVTLLDTVPPQALQEQIHQLGTEVDARLTVIDSAGTVLADSRAEPARMENHRLRPEVIAALRDGWGQAIHRSRTLPEAMLYVARRVRTPHGRLLIVRTSVDLQEIRQWAAIINRRILLAAAILLLLALGSSLLFTRSVVQPVFRLQRAAQRIASGDLTVRVPEQRRDELGALARAVNAMTEQLQKLFAAANSERGLLQAIVGSMTEAVLVLDRQHRIVLANPSFEQEFKSTALSGPDGKFLWETLRSADLQDLVERVIRENRTVAAELRIGLKSFDATAVPLKGERNEIVVVLHDVTQLKALDKVKADLVTNVSHELRTPLTAIKGYAETLEDEVPEPARRFLEIIRRHTDRLIALVNDLLVLSQLESGERQLETEPVDLAEVASDALKLLEKQIADKGLKAEILAAPGLTRVRADRFLLEQAFINLLDNAVKYTATGGIAVRLAPASPNQMRIEIADTGAGIPSESLGRIFERFYVVDKNRSRELGGTGLGLAIVKRIVLAHDGAVAVESGLGQGTVFTILLPV
jgi:two-component system phosphate regulon sensor histidine kinase PhoR